MMNANGIAESSQWHRCFYTSLLGNQFSLVTSKNTDKIGLVGV